MSEPNAIGQFQAGVSPVGDQAWDYTQTVLSQYATAPTMSALLASMSAWFDARADIDNFFDYVFNLASAQGFGLDLWGRILNIGRVYAVQDTYHFGFAEAQGNPELDVGAFGQGVFWSGFGVGGNVALSDDAYRQLLLARAFALTCNTSCASLNALLRLLFPGRGNAFVEDNQNMSITYVMQFKLTPVEKTIVITSGVLPQPNGCAVSYSYQ